uniref:Uncharacterized protein n=1 Tax=Glossina pallidipes TaxID=7398 RepID=A0A1A9Z6L8_GLOPL
MKLNLHLLLCAIGLLSHAAQLFVYHDDRFALNYYMPIFGTMVPQFVYGVLLITDRQAVVSTRGSLIDYTNYKGNSIFRVIAIGVLSLNFEGFPSGLCIFKN